MYFLPSALVLIFGKIFGCGMMLLRVSLMLILHVIDPIKVSKSLGYNLGECLGCLRNYYVYVLIRERIKMFEMYCIMFKYYVQHFQPVFFIVMAFLQSTHLVICQNVEDGRSFLLIMEAIFILLKVGLKKKKSGSSDGYLRA